ncbi:MAG: glycosyltransferase family 4 protein [Desulfosporosinus sp.]|nr:glycosyltransferase family 4 protein [Desulfosporosinus sp.]
MNLLHLCISNYYIDNYSYQENLLPKYHKLNGYNVSIIASLKTFDANGNPSFLEKGSSYINEYGIPVTRLNYKSPFKSISKQTRSCEGTYEAIARVAPDIIFIHGCQFLDMYQVVKYVKKNPEVKIYVDNHSDFINSAGSWVSRNIFHKIVWRRCVKLIEPYTTMFYGVLPARVDFLIKMYNLPQDKVELLIMGADDEKLDFENQPQIRKDIRDKLEIGMDDFVLITGGKIDRRKNVHLLLQAMKEIEDNKIKLIVFGSCDEEMRAELSLLSNRENIRNIGWISASEQNNYFLASDLAVFPGTHSVLWEQAIGAGLPCIFKKWDGMQHVDVGGNCLFLNQDSVLEIKQMILKLYHNRDLFNTMKSVAIQKGIVHFSYSEIAKRSIKLDK